MSAFTLRPATSTDSTAIRGLVREARISPFGLNWQRFIVANNEQDGLVGCGQIKIHRGKSDTSLRELASIAVTPEWQGKGIARRMIEYLLAATPPPIYLTCRASLEAFYQRFGFTKLQIVEMPDYYRRIIHTVKILSALRIMPEEILVMEK